MNKVLRFGRRHAPELESLSALLDGELDPPAAVRLNEHIASCAACSSALDGLRTTRAALRAMPDMETPRSFALRAADVERASRVVSRPAPRFLRWAPAVGALATAVFVVALGADLRSSGGGERSAFAPSAARQTTGAQSSESGLSGGKSANDSAATPAAGPTVAASLALPDTADSAASAPPAPGPAGATAATPASVAAARSFDAATADTASTYAVRSSGTAPSESPVAATDINRPSSEDGNNLGALRVLEVIAAATALAAAAAVFVWRRRGVRT